MPGPPVVDRSAVLVPPGVTIPILFSTIRIPILPDNIFHEVVVELVAMAHFGIKDASGLKAPEVGVIEAEDEHTEPKVGR